MLYCVLGYVFMRLQTPQAALEWYWTGPALINAKGWKYCWTLCFHSPIVFLFLQFPSFFCQQQVSSLFIYSASLKSVEQMVTSVTEWMCLTMWYQIQVLIWPRRDITFLTSFFKVFFLNNYVYSLYLDAEHYNQDQNHT